MTHLAVNKKASSSTRNQAMNALVFLYRKVLKKQLDEKIDAVTCHQKSNCFGSYDRLRNRRGKTDVWKWVADVGDHTFSHARH